MLKGDDENSSNHASTIFKRENDDVRLWFRSVVVAPVLWELDHPLDNAGLSNSVQDYFETFPQEYKIWDIQQGDKATQRITFYDGTRRSVTISGRADFLVTKRWLDEYPVTLANYLENALCVIEVQSKPDEVQCEYQILEYLYSMMNCQGLDNLIGILVFTNCQCKAYRATREDGDVVYEENDRFHVSHIAKIFVNLLK